MHKTKSCNTRREPFAASLRDFKQSGGIFYKEREKKAYTLLAVVFSSGSSYLLRHFVLYIATKDYSIINTTPSI
ncbi:unnamed protein product [Bathycoccus prasinos]